MEGKNNVHERFSRSARKDKRYTLKKLSVGLASVALGTIMFLNEGETVNAEVAVPESNKATETLSDIDQTTFQFSYVRNGEQIDGFLGNYTDASTAEKDFRHYANQQGYTLQNIRLEGNIFIADIQVDSMTFQFKYLNGLTDETLDHFFGEYINVNEAEKAFRMYASEAGYTLENIQFDNHNSFTATIAQNSTDRYVEAAKGRARNLISGLDVLTDELKADYLEQVGAAISVEEVEAVYNEAVEMANQQKQDANRYVTVAKDRAHQLIKDATNLTNDQKAHYLSQVEAAASVAEIEMIYAEATNADNKTTDSPQTPDEESQVKEESTPTEEDTPAEEAELDVPVGREDAKKPSTADANKASALNTLGGLDLDDVIKDSLIYDLNEATNEEEIDLVMRKAFGLVAAKLVEEPVEEESTPAEETPTEETPVEEIPEKEEKIALDKLKEEALGILENMADLSDEVKRNYAKDIKSAIDEDSVKEAIVQAYKQRVNTIPNKPADKTVPAPSKLDEAKSEALGIIGKLTLDQKIKDNLLEQLDDATEESQVSGIVGLAYKLYVGTLQEEKKEHKPSNEEAPVEEENIPADIPTEDASVEEETPTEEVPVNDTPTSRAIANKASLSDDELYARATDDKYIEYKTQRINGMNWRVPHKMTEQEIDAINSGKAFDFVKYNQYMIELVNELRTSRGLNPLTYDPELMSGGKIRTQELAREGSLYPMDSKTGQDVVGNDGEKLKHVRPESEGFRKWYTAFSNDVRDGNGIGENILSTMVSANPYEAYSEKAIAERMFKQWKKSPGHFANMINPVWTKMYSHYNVGSRLRTQEKERPNLDGAFAGQWFRTNKYQ